jgi:hypothetical protein
MHPFKLSAGFYIVFTAVTLLPATWFAQLFQNLLEHSSGEFLQSLAQSRIIEAPSAILLILALFWIYENWLWRLWLVRTLHGVPYIAGRYEGHVESSYDGKNYPVVVEIQQTLTNVTVCLYTERSSSYSFMATIGKNGNGNAVLTYAYKNTPRTVSTDEDMRAHDGLVSLEIFPAEHRLNGYYFNDPRERGRHGKLICTFVSQRVQGHF